MCLPGDVKWCELSIFILMLVNSYTLVNIKLEVDDTCTFLYLVPYNFFALVKSFVDS